MNCEKIGKLIYTLRKEKNMTQKELADTMNISDKAISKWERGLGCPDISLLPELSKIFNVNIEELLSGSIALNELNGGNMKKLAFYVCPNCNNLVTASGNATVSCCGKKLEAQTPIKALEDHRLVVDTVEDELYITSPHEMSKVHYLSFIAYVTGDRVLLVKQYPEWNMQVRFAKLGHGKLYFYCVEHGLYYQVI